MFRDVQSVVPSFHRFLLSVKGRPHFPDESGVIGIYWTLVAPSTQVTQVVRNLGIWIWYCLLKGKWENWFWPIDGASGGMQRGLAPIMVCKSEDFSCYFMVWFFHIFPTLKDGTCVPCTFLLIYRYCSTYSASGVFHLPFQQGIDSYCKSLQIVFSRENWCGNGGRLSVREVILTRIGWEEFPLKKEFAKLSKIWWKSLVWISNLSIYIMYIYIYLSI